MSTFTFDYCYLFAQNNQQTGAGNSAAVAAAGAAGVSSSPAGAAGVLDQPAAGAGVSSSPPFGGAAGASSNGSRRTYSAGSAPRAKRARTSTSTNTTTAADGTTRTVSFVIGSDPSDRVLEVGGTTIHLAPANFSGVVLDIPTGQKNEYVKAKDQNNKNLSAACQKCTLYNRGVAGVGKLDAFLQGKPLSSVSERDLDDANVVVEELRGFIWCRRPEMRAALTKMQRPELKKLAVSVTGLEVVVKDVPNNPFQMRDLGGIKTSTTEAISVVVDGALIPSTMPVTMPTMTTQQRELSNGCAAEQGSPYRY